MKRINQKEDHYHSVECTICVQIYRPPIYLCSSGHSFCSVCTPKLDGKCALCRQEMTKARNYALEEVVKILNSSDEEVEIVRSSSKQSKIKCPLCGVECDSFENHAKDNHGYNGSENMIYTKSFEFGTWDSHLTVEERISLMKNAICCTSRGEYKSEIVRTQSGEFLAWDAAIKGGSFYFRVRHLFEKKTSLRLSCEIAISMLTIYDNK